MRRREVEKEIYEHMKAIKAIVEEYSPDDIYITLCVTDSGRIMFNNSYWLHPDEQKIDFYEQGKE